MIDLTVVWAGIIGFAIVAYVIMDGFDLGIGIMFPLFRPGRDRDTAMNSVAPVWDGNETWLVLGGGGLLAVFPLAYATILPALYAPLIAMMRWFGKAPWVGQLSKEQLRELVTALASWTSRSQTSARTG